jgi:integrase
MVKVGRKRPRYCGPGEFRAICDAAKDPLWLAFLMVVYTSGLRLMEAINLTWSDIDFEVGAVHVTRKTASEYVQAWTPKDKELRRIPLPEQAINLLTAWQPLAPEGCPYVFMELGRWEFFRQAVEEGRWKKGKHLVNNMLRRFKTLCRKAKVGPFTIHDLRRSCITNWAQQLPIHVVQELAGHSDIKTTQQYYLSVRPEDVAKAQAIQAALVKDILPVNATDPKLTQTGKKRVFPGKMPTEVKS